MTLLTRCKLVLLVPLGGPEAAPDLEPSTCRLGPRGQVSEDTAVTGHSGCPEHAVRVPRCSHFTRVFL